MIIICARCDKPILPEEGKEPIDKMSPSGAGLTLHVHKVLCPRPRLQTTPVRPASAPAHGPAQRKVGPSLRGLALRRRP